MKKIFKNLNKSLLVLTFVFCLFGLLMIQSASSMESYMRYGNSPYFYFSRQLIFVILGLIGSFVIMTFPTKVYKKVASFLMYVFLFALGGLFIYGYAANNAVSWFDFGFFKLQPSEVLKIVIILYMAVFYEKNINKLEEKAILLQPFYFIIPSFLLIAAQPDLGTASIIMGLSLLIFYAIPMPKKYKTMFNKLIIGGVLLILLIVFAFGKNILKSYQLERFNFLDPCYRYQEKSGYQLCNSFIAFNNGGVYGQGIGESTQKYLYLPESYTDFIFPIIVEEWGLIVGIIIIVLYLVMLILIYKIARNARNLRNSMIAYGVFCYLLLHIVVNLGGVMGLIPLTGVPLPFLSYGGSYCLSLMAAIGLVQRVHIENKLSKVKKR